MRLYTFKSNDTIRVGIEKGAGLIDLTPILKDNKNMISLISNYNIEEINEFIREKEIINFSEVEILSPITKPIHDVLALGLNYKKHIKESQSAKALGVTLPEFPVYFGKRATKIYSCNEEINISDSIAKEVDYEVELAIIIGKECKNISKKEALDYIFGFSIYNDISARELQRNHKQWFRGKGLDGFSIMGPCIVTRDEFSYPLNLNLSSRINGELRQNSNTKHMIFDIEHIVSDLSQGMTLEAGDIIITGTPEGVGMGFENPKYLKPGDICECYIENIGLLKNKFI